VATSEVMCHFTPYAAHTNRYDNMNKIIYALIGVSLFVAACNTDEENPPSQPQPNEQFNLLWEVPLPASLPQGIILDEGGRDYLYVASKSGGVLIFDNSTSPAQLISEVSIDNFGDHHAMHLTQQGDYLYIALGDFFGGESKVGLAIIDIRDPNNPITTDYWESTDILEGSAIVIVEDEYAYLGAMSKGIFVFDISDKNEIVLTEQFIPDVNFPVPNPNSVQEPNARF